MRRKNDTKSSDFSLLIGMIPYLYWYWDCSVWLRLPIPTWRGTKYCHGAPSPSTVETVLLEEEILFLQSVKRKSDHFIYSSPCIWSIYACVFVHIQGAMQFLENYEKEDITVAELEGNSNSLWTISPPSKQKMIEELMDPNSSFSVVFSWSIQR